jgi:hypothetical protein
MVSCEALMPMTHALSSRFLLRSPLLTPVLALALGAALGGPLAATASAQSGVGLAGFQFGWTAAEAQHACEGAGHSYSIERVGGAVVERCSAPLRDVGFPSGAEVVLNFCGPHLCRVVIIAQLDTDAATATVAATRGRLERKYGAPSQTDGEGVGLRTVTFDQRGDGVDPDQTARITLTASAGRGRRMVSLAYISRRQLTPEERREIEIVGAL